MRLLVILCFLLAFAVPEAGAQTACLVFYGDTGVEGSNRTLVLRLKAYSGGCTANNYTGSGSFTIQYASQDGSASSPADYSAVSTTYVLNSGDAGADIPIGTVDDSNYEATEGFSLVISSAVAADGLVIASGYATTASFGITDNDPQPAGSLVLSGSPLAENGGAATVNATLDRLSYLPTTVDLTFSGGATLTSDYTRSGTQIVIPAGSLTSASPVTITGVDDDIDELDQTVVADITSVTNGSENGVQQVTATITDDDDEPVVSFEADFAVSEAIGTQNVKVNLSRQSEKTVTVNVTVNPSSTATGAAVDISAQATSVVINPLATSGNLAVTIVNDTDDEVDETEILDLATLINATGTDQHTLTIQDNDAPVSIAKSATDLTEAGGTSDITASIPASQSLPITVTLGFTDPAGSNDYTTSGTTITIPAGQTAGSAAVTITATGDTEDEADEDILVDVDSVTDGQENGTQQQTVTIQDDDAVVTLAVSGTPSVEKALGVITYTASIATAQTRDVTVNLGFSGGADGSGTDYTGSGTQIVIVSPATSGTVTATIVDDILDETNETIVVDIASVVNGQESGTQQVTGIITDDDADLSFTKVVSTALDPDPANGTVSYTLSVKNNSGTTGATGVTVTDPSLNIITPATPYSAISVAGTSGGSVNTYSGTTWTIGDLGAGATATITLDVTLDVEYTVTNIAEILAATQDDPDSTPGNGNTGEDDYDTVTVRQFDHGDTPAAYASTASHEILSTGPVLGTLVDSDSDSQNDADTEGDDNDLDGDDDDSAVTAPFYAIGAATPLSVAGSGAGSLYAWVDYNQNNLFDVSEMEHGAVVASWPVTITLTPPSGSSGTTRLRLRVCTTPAECELPQGLAADGEVEDYEIEILGFDFGDAPDGPYASKAASGGPQHLVDATVTHRLGAKADADDDAQVDADATGDDLDGEPDEDGISFLTTLMVPAAGNANASVDVVTFGDGLLYAWLDLDQAAGFSDATEEVISAVPLGTAGAIVTTTVPFLIPSTSTAGTTFMRFRFCSAGTTCDAPTGQATDGEVEDYKVELVSESGVTEAAIVLPSTGTAASPWKLGLTAGGQLSVTAGGFTLFEISDPSGLNTLTLTGGVSSEFLLVDYSNGDPLPPGGLVFNAGDGDDELRLELGDQALVANAITFNGGGETGGGPGDTISLFNTAGVVPYSLRSMHTNEADGFLSIEDDGAPSAYDDLVIAYTSLEPILVTLTLTDAEFDFGATDDQILLNNGGTDDGFSFIDCVGCGEAVVFTNPTGNLIVRAGAGADTIDFTLLDALGAVPASIQINGNAGEDLFNITPSATYGMIVNGGAPSICPGDVLDLDLLGAGATGQTLSMGAPGVGNWSFDAHLAVNFIDMEIRADADTDVSVSAAWDLASGYPADEREVVYTLTNNGGDEVTCVTAAITLPVELNLIGTPSEFYPAAASGSYLPTTWEIDRLLPGDSATLTFRGVINTIVPGDLATAIDATAGVPSQDPDLLNNLASDSFEVLGVFRFPSKGTAISAAYMELPSGLERIIAGLFQGSPGFDTAVLCRIPDTGGLFTQTGVGDHWRPCGDGLPYPLHVNDLLVDDRDTPGILTDDRLWLASWGSAGLYYSDDFGETFVAAEPDLGSGGAGWANVYSLAKDAANVLYISANNGLVYRSFNDGGSWQQVSSLPGVASDTAWSLEPHPSVGGTLYGGTFGNGVFVTTDFGFTWEKLGGDAVNDGLLNIDNSGDDFAGHVFDMAFSPDDETVLFAGTGKGVWRLPLLASGLPAGAWSQMALTAVLDGGLLAVPEVRVLGFATDTADPDEDLLVGSWGLGAFVNETPVGGGAFSPLALRQGHVSMILAKPDGSFLVGTNESGIQPLSPEALSTAVEPTEAAIPDGYGLSQNYPNPFNPVTTIAFALPENGKVRLSVFDMLGREVEVLLDRTLTAGNYEVNFEAHSLPTGTYMYRLDTASGFLTRQLVLLK